MAEKIMSYEEAVAFLRDYIEREGKKQVEVAQELGISGGAISSFLKGTYKTPHQIIPRVAELAKVHEKKAITPREPDYVETSVSKTVINAITYARLRGSIAVVYGDAGVGKSWAIRKYAEENSLAVCITCSAAYSGMGGVTELIEEQLGIRERVTRKAMRAIVEKLKGSGRVLVIDEAQHLTYKAIDYIRCIGDEAKIGIAFVGNDKIHKTIVGDKSEDFSQLFSRMGMPRELRARNICREDVEKIFGPYGLEKGVIDLLHGVSRTPYGIRGAVNVFINAAAVFEQVDKQNVVKVMRDMNIG